MDELLFPRATTETANYIISMKHYLAASHYLDTWRLDGIETKAKEKQGSRPVLPHLAQLAKEWNFGSQWASLLKDLYTGVLHEPLGKGYMILHSI